MKKILFTFLFVLSLGKVYAIENIEINKDNLIPKFNTSLKKYNYFTDLSNINIEVKNSKNEIISGNGLFDIKDGINTFIINSSIYGDYEINVYKNYKEDKEVLGKLTNLEIKNYEINFDPNIYEYNISISNEDTLDISYELLNDSYSKRVMIEYLNTCISGESSDLCLLKTDHKHDYEYDLICWNHVF